MIEALALIAGAPAAYLTGMIVTMRVVIVNTVRDYCKNRYKKCSGCKRVFSDVDYGSPTTAVAAIHSCDWLNAWICGVLWPVIAPVYFVVKPARSFILHMPEQKLTLAERERLVELELKKATDDMDDATS
jgi:hypothetical protein